MSFPASMSRRFLFGMGIFQRSKRQNKSLFARKGGKVLSFVQESLLMRASIEEFSIPPEAR